MSEPSESEARKAVEAIFSQFASVEVIELNHVDYSNGYEHQFDYKIEYPRGTDTQDLIGKHLPISSQIDWIKFIQGMNETGQTEAEGTVRVYFGE